MIKKLIIPVSLIFFSCTMRKTTRLSQQTPQTMFAKGMSYYKHKKWGKSAALFQTFVYQFPTSQYADDAQYYLSMSYFKNRQLEDALTEFRFFIDNFPNSNYRKDAYYYLAYSYYLKSPRPQREQTALDSALSVISEFKEEYNNANDTILHQFNRLSDLIKQKKSIKLAYIVETYYNMKKYRAAEIYIDLIHKRYPDTQGDETARIFEAGIQKVRGKAYKQIITSVNPVNVPAHFKKYIIRIQRQD